MLTRTWLEGAVSCRSPLEQPSLEPTGCVLDCANPDKIVRSTPTDRGATALVSGARQ